MLTGGRKLRGLQAFTVFTRPGDAALGIGGGGEDEITVPRADGKHHLVRVKRQAAAIRVRGDLLHDAVDPAVGQCSRYVGVIQACITALRLRAAEQCTGLQVELLDLDVRGQGVALLRGE